MPHEASVQPEASTVSTGKGLRYVGNWIYGFSGLVTVQNSPVALFETTTGSGLIVCQIGMFTSDSSSNNAEIVVSLNDIKVIAFEVLNTTQGDYLNGFAPMDLIIPPFTKFELTAVNTTSSSEMSWYSTLTGRVYGAE